MLPLLESCGNFQLKMDWMGGLLENDTMKRALGPKLNTLVLGDLRKESPDAMWMVSMRNVSGNWLDKISQQMK